MALLYPVSALWPTRYGVGKTTFYARLKQLQIHPVRVEGRKETFLTEQQFFLFEQHYQPVVGVDELIPLEIEGECASVDEEALNEEQRSSSLAVSQPSELSSPSSAALGSSSGSVALGSASEQLEAEFQEIDSTVDFAGVITEEDLEDIDHRAQQRAGALEVVENYATLSYRATGAYTDEGVKAQVNKSRQVLKDALRGKSPVQDPKLMMDRLRAMTKSKVS